MRTESEIQRVICCYLKIKRYYFWRQNTTGMYRAGEYVSVYYAAKGLPDIFILSGQYTVALEVKSEKGRQTPDQKEFEAQWIKGDFRRYHIVRSIGDVIKLGL